jgi:hypothetical protein
MPQAVIGPVRVRLAADPETIEFFLRIFRPVSSGETILPPMKPFSTFGADVRKQPLGIKLPSKRRMPDDLGDKLMRTLSFILAFAFLLAGPSIAGSSDNLPAAGAFAYNGAATVHAAPLVLAAR